MTSGKRTTRRYSPEEKAQAVRLVRRLRAETGRRHGAVGGFNGSSRHLERVRSWDGSGQASTGWSCWAGADAVAWSSTGRGP